MCLFLPDYDAPFQAHDGKLASDPNIGADIPSMQRDNFHCKKL
jgi:hypothetical protein